MISLGDNCQPAHQIQRHFRTQESYLFDRWVISLDGLASYLASPSADIYEPSRLIPYLEDGEHIGFLNPNRGLQFYHEFPKDMSLHPKGVVTPGWEASVPKATERTSHLIEKFRALNKPTHTLLFVRRGDWVSGEPIAGEAIDTREALNRVAAELENMLHFANFDLLCVNFSHHYYPKMRGEIFYSNIPGLDDDWRGSNDDWSAAFEQICTHLAPVARVASTNPPEALWGKRV